MPFPLILSHFSKHVCIQTPRRWNNKYVFIFYYWDKVGTCKSPRILTFKKLNDINCFYSFVTLIYFKHWDDNETNFNKHTFYTIK